jgi:hypothetical protein
MLGKAVLQRTWAILIFSLVWGGWMLLVGAMPNLLSNRGLESLSFEYRDYLLRMFVVFLIAHLFVRETNFKLLFAIPPITLGLQLGLNVYDFSEWYSRTFRVNLHELNAQLFVVPVQILVLMVGIIFCCRKKLRTTTRIFATTMLAGSILSTLGFHLSIVNISYKPVERVYSTNLESLIALDDPAATCNAMQFDCVYYPLGHTQWRDDLLLDPRLFLAHRELLGEVMSSQMWVSRDNEQFWLGLAEPDGSILRLYEAPLPLSSYAESMDYVFGPSPCPEDEAVQCSSLDGAMQKLTDYSLSIVDEISGTDSFVHVWAHTHDFEGDGLVEPALIAAGRRDSGQIKMAFIRIPQQVLNLLSEAAQTDTCGASLRCHVLTGDDLAGAGLPGKIRTLYSPRNTFEAPLETWVDKALSRNPILYINRPEFLRSKTIEKGVVKIFSSPKAFSDITLDLKMSFNLIIGIFSTSWLTLGVFLILFHTRRVLLKEIYTRERASTAS